MLPPSVLGGNVVKIAIRNESKIAASHDVALVSGGTNVDTRSGIAVDPGGSWSDVVPLKEKLRAPIGLSVGRCARQRLSQGLAFEARKFCFHKN